MNGISTFLVELSLRLKDPVCDIYNLLVRSRLTEYCNDASLCLLEIDSTVQAYHPDDRDDELVQLSANALSACQELLAEVFEATRGANPLLINTDAQARGYYSKASACCIVNTAFSRTNDRKQIAKDLRVFLRSFNALFTLNEKRTEICASLRELSRLLLSLALAFEIEQRSLLSCLADCQVTTASIDRNLTQEMLRLSLCR